MRDLSLFSQENGALTPVVVQAPGGGFNPDFNNIFAQNLGFGPPPPGAQPMPPPQQAGPPGGGYGVQDYGAGRFDLGNGQQLQVKINGQSPENYVKNKVSGMIWGWIIGAAIVGLLVIGGGILGLYIFLSARSSATAVTTTTGPNATTVNAWDGKTALACAGNQHMTVTNITATAPIVASANCHIAMVNVNINTPMPITASGNAEITFTSGSVTGTPNAVVASGNAKVIFAGTKVTGKNVKSGNAQIVGAN